MITVNKAKTIILTKYKDSEILSIMKLKDGFLFSIQPKGSKPDEVLDAFFKVNSTGKLTEYSPVMDPSEFKLAQQNIIYKKK